MVSYIFSQYNYHRHSIVNDFIFTMLKAFTVSPKRQSDLYTFFILGINQKQKIKDKKFK